MRRFLHVALISLICFVATPPAFAVGTARIATGLERPVFLCSPPGDTTRLFILEQYTGRILIWNAGEFLEAPFLDIGSEIETGGNEQGLLGMAFDPNFSANGRFFVNYSRKGSGATVVSRFLVGTDANRAEPASEMTILTFDQPYSNHNGGMLLFGPDGNLWIGTGDGGSAGDPGNRAQNKREWLGKMLRIDVRGETRYLIPEGNPFASGSEGKPEVWAYGLRNPWRYCFDRAGMLYIADVGQNVWEEIHVVDGKRAGLNFGWRIMEGKHCFNPPRDCDESGLEIPVWEYDHQTGCSITGGYVYEGAAIPELQGHYFFTDYCTSRIWSFRYRSGGMTDYTEWTTPLKPGDGSDIKNISSFGLDGAGEMYILDHTDGEVFKIVP